jgi:hypothetical protein
LDKALEKHSEWKVKLRTAISKREEMDAATISRDDCCDFGKWLHQDVKSHLAHEPSYAIVCPDMQPFISRPAE